MGKGKKKASTNGAPVRGTTERLEEASRRARLDEAREMSPGDIIKKVTANQATGKAIKKARELNEKLQANLLTAKAELESAQTETKNLESQLKNREAELDALREIKERFDTKLESSCAEHSNVAASEALSSEETNAALCKSNELSAERERLLAKVQELTATRDKLQQKVGSR